MAAERTAADILLDSATAHKGKPLDEGLRAEVGAYAQNGY